MKALFDIGGTHTRVAVSPDGNTLAETHTYETPQSFDQGITQLVATIQMAVSELNTKNNTQDTLEAVVGCIPGVLSDSTLLASPHLTQWVGHDIQAEILKQIPTLSELSVQVIHDASLACLGEATFGAGVGMASVAYLTISTGIGGGRVVDGAIDAGVYHFEPGHQIIDINSRMTIEKAASGTAIKERYHSMFNMMPRDPVYEQALADISDAIAVAVHNAIVFWSPEVCILGGSVILDSPELFDAVAHKVSKLLTIYPHAPKIIQAQLGDQSGLYGALALTEQI